MREKAKNIERATRYFIRRNVGRFMYLPSYISRSNDASITVITSAYNESYLAPLFFRHYAFAEKIVLLLDMDTTDSTAEIAGQFKNVEIHPIVYPKGFDDDVRADAIINHYSKVSGGYVLNVDMDEFAFIENNNYTKYELSHIELYNVYRHHTESDISTERAVKEQRRHGVLDLMFRKPILVRAGLDLRWHPGNHEVTIRRKGTSHEKVTISDNWSLSKIVSINFNPYKGAHWANADISFCIHRRVANRRNRFSNNNINKGYGVQHFTISEADVINECRIHEHDPKVW